MTITMSSAHSPTFPSLYLYHSSSSNSSVASPISQLILQPFRCFTYVTLHSPTLPLLHLYHSSFSNSPVASPTSQFILQPFFRFSYIVNSSHNSPGEPPMSVAITFYPTVVICCVKLVSRIDLPCAVAINNLLVV